MTFDPRDRIHLPRLGRQPDAEIDQEIDAHLQLAIDDLVARGLSTAEARTLAEKRFGDMTAARHELHIAARRREHQLRHRDWITALSGDVRFGLRQIRRSASHSVLVIATLALGIGLTTTMFTLVERILVSPLPYPHPDQLVAMQGRDSVGNVVATVSDDDWLDWRDGMHSLATMAVYGSGLQNTVLAGDSAVRLRVVRTSGAFFAVLQPRFLLGRAYTLRDEANHDGAKVVVSERVWRDVMGSDSSLMKGLHVGSGAFQVVGVIDERTAFPAGTDIWSLNGPVRGTGGRARNNINWLALARLKTDVTPAEASADMSQVAQGIRARDPGGFYDFRGAVVPLQSTVVDSDTTSSLRLLMECVLVVLMIVCANLAIATLGRGAMRQHEMAVRASLGASRSRLVVQLLVEHLLLAGLGGALALGVAWGLLRLVVGAWGPAIPRAEEVHLDLRIVAFAVAISVLVGLTAGIVPAVSGSRTGLQGMMKRGARGVVGGKHRPAELLVVAEFALALMLLTGAGLLIRSFQSLLGRDLGFNRRVATVSLVLSGPAYSSDSTGRLATWDRLIAAYRSIPSVQSVGVANQIPLHPGFSGFVDFPGREGSRDGAAYRVVSEDYFNAIGMRIVSGRSFGPGDSPGSLRAVVINQAMARKYWPNEDPIGKQVRARSMEAGTHGETAPWLTVIGVVSDVRQFGPEGEFAPEMYSSFRQAPQRATFSMSAVVRGTVPPSQLVPAIRSRTREVDPQLAGDIGTMDGALSRILAGRQLTMSLLGGFAGLALLLAALGIYAVLSYTVAQRTQELAIRSALGARRGNLIGMILRDGAATVGLGLALGVAAAVVVTRLLRAMVVDVSTLDPLSLAGAVLVLSCAAAVAILIPARRATRHDPLLVMKGE